MNRYLFFISFLTCFFVTVTARAVATDDEDVRRSYDYALSLMKDDTRRYAEARDTLISLQRRAGGEIAALLPEKIAMSWYLQGTHELVTGNSDSAYVYLDRALDAYRATGNMQGQAKCLFTMGDMMRLDGKTSRGIGLLEQSMAAAAAAHDDNVLLESVEALRYIYNDLNEMDKYARYGYVIDSLYDATTDLRAKMRYSLKRGNEMVRQGDYDMAEYFYNRYRAIGEEINADDSRYVPIIYCMQMTSMKQNAGLYDEALRYSLEELEEAHRAENDSHIMWYTPYLDVADAYMYLNDTVAMQLYLDSAFVIFDKNIGDEDDRKMFLVKRGLCYKNTGQYDKALADFDAVDLMGDTDDPTRIYHLEMLILKGIICHDMKSYDEAVGLFEQYSQQVKEMYGDSTAVYAQSLYYLGNCAAYAGDMERGADLLSKASKMMMADFRGNLKYVSSAERETYWNKSSSLLFDMTPYAVKSGYVGGEFARNCYDALLFSKALLLETELSLYHMLQTHGTQQDVDDFGEMTALRSRVSRLNRDFSKNSDEIAALKKRMRDIDNRLTHRSATYNDYSSFLLADYDDVRLMLADDDLLVDYYDYVSESDGLHRYVAYVIKRDMRYPQIVSVCTLEAIDSLMKDGKTYDLYDIPADTTDGMSAVDVLWKPLERYAVPGAKVYYVPSGAMFRIALESLPDADGRLLGRRYDFVRLSSARNIRGGGGTIPQDAELSAVLYGGLTYEVDPDIMALESGKYDISPLLTMRGNDVTGTEGFRELPQTLHEVDAIGDILRSNGYRTVIYSGISGTEESFLNMDGQSPRILHVATHGFYYTADDAAKTDYLKGYKDAMSLSGLIFAGANAAWRGDRLPQGVLTGVLTADKIACLDLSATDMVVLSACQTAQGNATAEGVYGLQRAFKKAGAATMVMTLWNVSDVVTREFMTEFYAGLPANGWNKRKAFETARQTIRDRYPEPFYWAAFVMVD